MRVSIGIELNEQIKQGLTSVQEELSAEFKEVTWLKPEQLFLTVLFLGNPLGKARRKLKPTLIDAASQSAPFTLELGRAGCFPEQGPPRTVFANIQEQKQYGLTMLERFQRECHKSYGNLGIKLPEKNFLPHIVLGRVSSKTAKGPLRASVEKFAFNGLSQAANEACLIEARLGKEGPKYEISAKVPFSANIAS